MKTPITEANLVVINCEQGVDGYIARAGGKLRATSTGSAATAAWNLAARIFFGGNTKAFIGQEEREALQVEQRGESGLTFVAWINTSRRAA
jgi:hypothetical protein